MESTTTHNGADMSANAEVAANNFEVKKSQRQRNN
jgi:hypothetical protein